MKKKMVAVLMFGPMKHEIEIDAPRPTIEMVVPKRSLSIFDKRNMNTLNIPTNYIRLIFSRQETGHEVDGKVWINYDLWAIREEM